ncbi:hypothetical protein B0H14DRAFT_2563301 [Mycena olivaceomarginata]|nr:hypothetical protein B0H14DRAFT_2563301 [Mycena olivaceomarginata]
MFHNQPRDDQAGTLSTFNLNRFFDFASVGDEESVEAAYGQSPGHIISNFLYLSVADLTAIARTHSVPTDGNKSTLLQALMYHECPFVARAAIAVNLGVKFLAAHTTNVAEFVELYRSFTIKQLSSLCETHNIWPGKTKSFLESLLKHNCDPGVPDIQLFCCSPSFDGTIESVRREETLRRDRFEMNKTLKASSASASGTHPILRRDAAEKAANDARQAFPFVADLSHQKRIAQEWQTEMEPRRWIPRPCAVCGRRTVTGMLTFCNPLHYDLAVAPNPALPVETLTKTHDLDAYDGAILCASALQDPTQKAPFEMCVYCKTAMDRHQQPLDSLANFQYYARDELPPEVKSAFRDATTYDKMIDKDGRERPDSVRSTSQRYSKDNVAIFTQDVASLRAVLQPPREDIHEVIWKHIGKEFEVSASSACSFLPRFAYLP